MDNLPLLESHGEVFRKKSWVLELILETLNFGMVGLLLVAGAALILRFWEPIYLAAVIAMVGMGYLTRTEHNETQSSNHKY
ncbi:MAG TPA: hypothetical protein VEC17_03410 [Candidatus Binatia bacterium]|nr:hypothetical protein [Candidatus Binatia bacterium]